MELISIEEYSMWVGWCEWSFFCEFWSLSADNGFCDCRMYWPWGSYRVFLQSHLRSLKTSFVNGLMSSLHGTCITVILARILVTLSNKWHMISTTGSSNRGIATSSKKNNSWACPLRIQVWAKYHICTFKTLNIHKRSHVSSRRRNASDISDVLVTEKFAWYSIISDISDRMGSWSGSDRYCMCKHKSSNGRCIEQLEMFLGTYFCSLWFYLYLLVIPGAPTQLFLQSGLDILLVVDPDKLCRNRFTYDNLIHFARNGFLPSTFSNVNAYLWMRVQRFGGRGRSYPLKIFCQPLLIICSAEIFFYSNAKNIQALLKFWPSVTHTLLKQYYFSRKMTWVVL